MSKILVIGAAPPPETLAAAKAVREVFATPLVLVKQGREEAFAKSGWETRSFDGPLDRRNPGLLRALFFDGPPARKGIVVAACGQAFNHFQLLRLLSEIFALPGLGADIYIHYRGRIQKVDQEPYRRHPERLLPARLRQAWSVLVGDQRYVTPEECMENT